MNSVALYYPAADEIFFTNNMFFLECGAIALIEAFYKRLQSDLKFFNWNIIIFDALIFK